MGNSVYLFILVCIALCAIFGIVFDEQIPLFPEIMYLNWYNDILQNTYIDKEELDSYRSLFYCVDRTHEYLEIFTTHHRIRVTHSLGAKDISVKTMVGGF